MDLQKDYLCLEENRRVECKNIDLDFDFQETLPAYVDDIYRIVKCCAKSYITSADISFNEIKVFGKVNVYLTYYNENSLLCYADFEEDFNRSISAENLSDNAFVCAHICDKYTSFRVINQRRIDIHLSSLLHIDVYDKVKCPCLKDCEGAKLKKEKIKAADVIANTISRIEFDEEFGLPAGSQPIKRIVSFTVNSSQNDVRVIKDKVLLKVNVDLSILYTTDVDDELNKTEYSFTASKIIEITGVSDDDKIISIVDVGNVLVKAKNKTGDKLDTVNVYGELSVNSLAIHEEEKEIITDAYVLNHSSQSSYTDFNIISSGHEINETRQVNISFALPSEVSEVKEIELIINSFSFKNSNINAQVRYNAITLNNGELTSVFGDSEFELPVEAADGAFASLAIQSFDYSLSQNNTIDVRAAVSVNAYVYNDKTYKLINDIDADVEVLKHPAITVYFGKENESVWEIAKAFSSDSNQIMKENSLTDESLNTNRVLIIPNA